MTRLQNSNDNPVYEFNSISINVWNFFLSRLFLFEYFVIEYLKRKGIMGIAQNKEFSWEENNQYRMVEKNLNDGTVVLAKEGTNQEFIGR